MKLRKALALGLCTAMAVTSFAGCSVAKNEASSSDASTSTNLKGKGKDELHILIYAQEHEKAAYEEQIKKFTEAHKDQIKNVNFEVTTQDEYNTKMTAAITANDLPDIFHKSPIIQYLCLDFRIDKC